VPAGLLSIAAIVAGIRLAVRARRLGRPAEPAAAKATAGPKRTAPAAAGAPATAARGWLAGAGRWSARHPWWVAGAWLIVLVLATAGHRALGGTYSDDFTLPGSAAQQGAAVLQAHDPSAGGQSGQLVFTVSRGTLSGDRSAIEGAVASVRKLPHVLSATDPLSPSTTSENGQTAYSTVNFSENPVSLGSSYITQVDNAVAGARAAGVSVSYGGQLGQAAQPNPSDLRSEAIGIIAAIGVLLLGFGSVFAAGLPVISAVVGAITGIGVLGMAAAATTFASVSPTLGVMMGLGVGLPSRNMVAGSARIPDLLEPLEAPAPPAAVAGAPADVPDAKQVPEVPTIPAEADQ